MHMKKKAKEFRFITPHSSLPTCNADVAGPNRRGSVNVSTPLAFTFQISLMLIAVLSAENLSGMGFCKVRSADGVVSQF